MSLEDVPDGFAVQKRSSAFLQPFEPLYEKREGGTVTIGVRLRPAHLNGKGLAHGAFLTALADIAMGRSLVAASDPPQRFVSVSLALDFHSPAREGDWLEARVNHLRVGSRVSFASCFLMIADGVAGDKVVARGNGTFTGVQLE
jgi:uncharacterized protein (TIGR00369 family)